MSTTIRLDASALSSIIAADPDFKLELQRAICVEVVRKVYLKDFGKVLEGVVPELFAEMLQAMKTDVGIRFMLDERMKATVQSIRSGTHGYSTARALPKETIDLISFAVNDLVRKAIDERVGRVDKITEDIISRLLVDLTERAEQRIAATVDARLERIITTKVNERITAIVSGLAQEG